MILFGATGMVGQGVLRECLLEDRVASVLAVGRTPVPHATIQRAAPAHTEEIGRAMIKVSLKSTPMSLHGKRILENRDLVDAAMAPGQGRP